MGDRRANGPEGRVLLAGSLVLAGCVQVLGIEDWGASGSSGGQGANGAMASNVEGSASSAGGSSSAPTAGPTTTSGSGGSGGGCASVETDPHNCGVCGHDCLGGSCSGGVCQIADLGAPAPGQFPIAVAALDDWVVLSSTSRVDAVKKLDGTFEPIAAVNPYALGGESNFAFVVTASGIERYAEDGGSWAPTLVGSGTGISTSVIAVDSIRLLFPYSAPATSGGGIFKLTSNGSNQIADIGSVSWPMNSPTFVDLVGSTAVVLLNTTPNAVLVVDADSGSSSQALTFSSIRTATASPPDLKVYYATYAMVSQRTYGATTDDWSVPIAGVTALHRTGAHLYYVAPGPSTGELGRIDLATHTPEVIEASGTRAFDVDDQGVYWVLDSGAIRARALPF